MICTYKDVTYSLTQTNRKTVSIYVEPDGSLTVRAPSSIDLDKINRIVDLKRPWIYKGIAELRELNRTKIHRTLANGEGYSYMGKSYRLKIGKHLEQPFSLSQNLARALGKTYSFKATFRAEKSPDLEGSPTAKPGVLIHYAHWDNFPLVVGSSATVTHPEGAEVTFSALGDYEWYSSVSYSRQDFWFLQMVSDIVDNPEPPPPFVTKIPANTDVDPDRLNLRSRGRWTPCHIELPEGYDLNDVNLSSIRLDDTIPAQVSPATIGDYDSDGVPDLTFRFNRTEIQLHLLSEGFMFGDVALKVSEGFSTGPYSKEQTQSESQD